MGWGTELFCNIYYSKNTFNNLREVEDAVDDIKAQLETCKKTLRDLAIMTEPAKYMESDSDRTPYDFVCQEFDDNIELYHELCNELFKLELLWNNWKNSHTEEGLAIDPPDNVKWDSAFLRGDFVKSVKYPDVKRFME